MVNPRLHSPDHEGLPEQCNATQLLADDLPRHDMKAPVRYHTGQDD